MTRTLDTDNERARSRDRLVICEPFTPGAGWISKRVMTGSGVAATTCALTPNDSRWRSTSRDRRSSSSSVYCLPLGRGGSRIVYGGSGSPSTGGTALASAFFGRLAGFYDVAIGVVAGSYRKRAVEGSSVSGLLHLRRLR